MDESAAAQSYVLGVPILSVLLFGVFNVLAGEMILQLGSRNRDAVKEQAEVDGFVGLRIKRQLPGDREPVGIVLGDQLRSNPVSGLRYESRRSTFWSRTP